MSINTWPYKRYDHIRVRVRVRIFSFPILGCMTYVWHDGGSVFTGDSLLIRGCGRTDFQQGSSEKLYHSIHKQIFTLPEHFTVYPGHDYTGQTSSTVGEEKRFNTRLTKSQEDFTRFMKELKLAYPHQIGEIFHRKRINAKYSSI